MLTFSKLDVETSYTPGSSEAARTTYSLDKSRLLQSIPDPVAELQIRFMMLLCGQNLDGFALWRKLVSVLCNGNKERETRPVYGIHG